MTNLVADSNGRIVGQFTIPGDNTFTSGPKLVEFFGEATQASATFVGEGTLTTETLRVVNNVTRTTFIVPPPQRPGGGSIAPGVWEPSGGGPPPPEITPPPPFYPTIPPGFDQSFDPLAQTFMLGETTQLAAIDLWFLSWNDVTRAWDTTVGTTPVVVQLRDVRIGLPTLDVFAESRLTAEQITQQMAANGFVRFPFSPVVLEANREYCFVAMCNDAVSQLALAGMDEFDTSTNRYVGVQPYTVGVLLSSSNNRTWTPHQKQDLTFRLLKAQIALADRTKTVDIGSVSFSSPVHSLLVLAAVDRPSSDTDVVFTLSTGSGPTLVEYECYENQPISLVDTYTGTVHLSALLTGTENLTPTLHRDITVVGGLRQEGSVYITRSMSTNLGVATDCNVSVYYDAFLPVGSGCTASIQNGEVADEPVFEAMIAPEVGATTDLGDGWIEYRWDYDALAQPDTRIKLELTGSWVAIPRIKNLRVVMI